jgi:hypothetical protein
MSGYFLPLFAGFFGPASSLAVFKNYPAQRDSRGIPWETYPFQRLSGVSVPIHRQGNTKPCACVFLPVWGGPRLHVGRPMISLPLYDVQNNGNGGAKPRYPQTNGDKFLGFFSHLLLRQ